MKTFRFLFTLPIAIIIFSCGGSGSEKVIEESGTIESTDIVISSQTSGKIIMINKDEGSQIQTGDTILVIDHEALDIQLKQMNAARDIARAQFDLVMKGARQEDITQAEEGLKQAETNFTNAATDKERMTALLRSTVITQKQYDDAAARFDIAQAQLNSTKENYAKVKNISRPEEKIQAQANYQKAEAGVEAIKKNIRDCFVVSPISGYVVKKFVELGESVSMLSSLVKVSDLSKLEVIIYVAETELGKIKLGQLADVSVDSFPDKIFKGNIIFISSEAEFTPKNIQTKDERTKLVFAVKIEIENPKLELKSGLPADVKLHI